MNTSPDTGKPTEKVLHYAIKRLTRTIIEVQDTDASPVAAFLIPRAVPDADGSVQADVEMFVKITALPEPLRTQVRDHLKTLAPPPPSRLIIP